MYVRSGFSASMDQPGMVTNPARGQLNREHNFPLSPLFAPEVLVLRVGVSRPVSSQPKHSPHSG